MRRLTDLPAMLATLDPKLQPGEFVFCSLPDATPAEVLPLDPIGFFTEPEGLTVILRKEVAEENKLAFAISLRWITLRVHSDLAAVGLTAAFATCLAAAGISANVVAGAYHDHIFVPGKDAERAMQALWELQAQVC